MSSLHPIRRRGATLVEVITGFAVFTFMMLASIALMRIGTSGWRVVESKSDVNRSLSRFEIDAVQEIKRASLASVGVYTAPDDYRWALWMKTPMNDPSRVDGASNPTVPLGDAILPILANGVPIMQRYILYYVARPDRDEHRKRYGFLCASYNSDAGPDTICPHKWIVKKELYLLSGKTTGTDTIGLQGDASAVARLKTYTHDPVVTTSALLGQQESFNSSSVVRRVQVLCENILSFEVTRLALDTATPTNVPRVSSTGPIVLFDIKAFKAIQSGNAIEVGTGAAHTVTLKTQGTETLVDVESTTTATGEINYHTKSVVDAKYAPFTVQLDNRVIPQNP